MKKIFLLLALASTTYACEVCEIVDTSKYPDGFWTGYNQKNTRICTFGNTGYVRSSSYCLALQEAYSQVPQGGFVVGIASSHSRNKNQPVILTLRWVIKKGFENYGKK